MHESISCLKLAEGEPQPQSKGKGGWGRVTFAAGRSGPEARAGAG